MLDQGGWFIVTCELGSTYDDVIAATTGQKCSIPTTIEACFPGKVARNKDYWFIQRFFAVGKFDLHVGGISALAEIWINGVLLATVQSMHLPIDHTVDLDGDNIIAIRCVLTDNVQLPRVRQRWRQQLTVDQKLRQVRNTFLGKMPGWCPVLELTGPYRPITLTKVQKSDKFISDLFFLPHVISNSVFIYIEFRAKGFKNIEIKLDDTIVGSATIRQAPDQYESEFDLDNAKLWFPHTHGEPYRYSLKIIGDGEEFDFGFVGIRSVAMRNQCGIVINDVEIFCRGAVWTATDIVSLSSNPSDCRRLLQMVCDAGCNMVRVPGTGVFETNVFYDICDELGILVWQDFMFANFDYPQTNEFLKIAYDEAAHFVHRTRHNPSIIVFCGGSEVFQQAAMFGLMSDQYTHKLFSETLPEALQDSRSYSAVYVGNTPCGGQWPFQTNVELTHYFGVPAYLREFSDIRRADVKFASECMAIANVPCTETIKKMAIPAVHHPKWKESVPRDNNVSWDFEDVRDHYLEQLFHVKADYLRRTDQERYLELSRAVPCIITNELFSEWRSHPSECNGGLILNLKDLTLGSGWGLIDADYRPKSTYYALKHVSNSFQIVITDEGLNGLNIHLINESDKAIEGVLKLESFKDCHQKVIGGEIPATVPKRSTICYSSREIIPHFFDICYSYKFGPASHNVTRAYFSVDGNDIIDAFHFPQGHDLSQQDIGLDATLENIEGSWQLHVSTVKFAQLLHIDIPGYTPQDNWINLAPNSTFNTWLIANESAPVKPFGFVLALNSLTNKIVKSE